MWTPSDLHASLLENPTAKTMDLSGQNPFLELFVISYFLQMFDLIVFEPSIENDLEELSMSPNVWGHCDASRQTLTSEART